MLLHLISHLHSIVHPLADTNVFVLFFKTKMHKEVEKGQSHIVFYLISRLGFEMSSFYGTLLLNYLF